MIFGYPTLHARHAVANLITPTRPGPNHTQPGPTSRSGTRRPHPHSDCPRHSDSVRFRLAASPRISPTPTSRSWSLHAAPTHIRQAAPSPALTCLLDTDMPEPVATESLRAFPCPTTQIVSTHIGPSRLLNSTRSHSHPPRQLDPNHARPSPTCSDNSSPIATARDASSRVRPVSPDPLPSALRRQASSQRSPSFQLRHVNRLLAVRPFIIFSWTLIGVYSTIQGGVWQIHTHRLS